MERHMDGPRPAVVTDDPQIEMASDEGRVIADLPGLVQPGEFSPAVAGRLPFAALFQATLIIVMAVMNGFREELLDRILRVPADRVRQHPAGLWLQEVSRTARPHLGYCRGAHRHFHPDHAHLD